MKKVITLICAVLLASLFLAACSSSDSSTEEKEYNYISAEDVKSKIENNEAMYLLDIQPEDEFDKHHIVGAVPTYAYPAKEEADHAKLAPLVDELKATDDPIVIVCPGGGSGAKGTIDYYVEQGVPADKLLILEKGQRGWPYEELLADE